jgi:hypothetical protein
MFELINGGTQKHHERISCSMKLFYAVLILGFALHEQPALLEGSVLSLMLMSIQFRPAGISQAKTPRAK